MLSLYIRSSLTIFSYIYAENNRENIYIMRYSLINFIC